MTDQQKRQDSEAGENVRGPAEFPSPELSIRIASLLVKYFPRRLLRPFGFGQGKIIQEAILLKADLQEIDYPELADDQQVSLVSHDSVAELANQPGGLNEEVYRRRLERGDLCYLLKVDDEPASYTWISLVNCAAYNGFDQEINFWTLNELQSYNYDLYTYKPYRKLGYGSILGDHMRADLFQRGRREIYAGIEPDNHRSLRIHLRSNYRLAAVVTNLRLMNWSWSLWSGARRLRAVEGWLENFSASLKHRY